MSDTVDLRALEVTLSAVPGVRSAVVEADNAIHVELIAGTNEDDVRRDVTAILASVFDVGSLPTNDTTTISETVFEDPHDEARVLPIPQQRFTVIRGGLSSADEASAMRTLTGSSVHVPDLDLDMLQESQARHPAGKVTEALAHAEFARQRERSPYVPPMFESSRTRPVLVRLRTTSSATATQVSVVLRYAGHLIEGIADSVPTPTATREAIIDATLDSLTPVLHTDVTLARHAVALVELGEDDAAIVQVQMSGPDGAEILTGVSTVRDDSRAAISRATLDAINRRIAVLLD